MVDDDPTLLNLTHHDDVWQLLDRALDLADNDVQQQFPAERAATIAVTVIEAGLRHRTDAGLLATDMRVAARALDEAARSSVTAFDQVRRALNQENSEQAETERAAARRNFSEAKVLLDSRIDHARAVARDLHRELQASGLHAEAADVLIVADALHDITPAELSDGAQIDALGDRVTATLERARTTLDRAVALDERAGTRGALLRAIKAQNAARDKEQFARGEYRAELDGLRSLKARGAVIAAEAERLGTEVDVARDAGNAEQIDAAVDAFSRYRDTTVADHHEALVRALRAARNYAPAGSSAARLFDALHTEVRSAHLEASMGQISAQLRDGIGHLRQRGSSSTTTLTVSAGVSYAAVSGAPKGSVSYVQGLQWKISKGAGTKFSASFAHSESVQGGLKVGADGLPVSAVVSARLGAAFGKTREYDSFEELIQNETAIVTMLPLTIDRKANGGKTIDLLREAKRLRIDAAARRPLLKQDLIRIGAMREQDSIVAIKPYEVAVTTTTSSAITGGVSASAVATWKRPTWDAELADSDQPKRLGASGGLSVSGERARVRKYRKVGYLDAIREQPVLQELAAISTPEVFGFDEVATEGTITRHSGQQAVDRLKAVARDIAQLNAQVDKTRRALAHEAAKANPDQQTLVRRQRRLERQQAGRSDLAETLAQSMGQLQQEYRDFVQLHNQIEDGRITRTDATRQQLRRALTARGLSRSDDRLFVQSLNRRALKPADTAKFLRAVSLQFASLARVYESAFPDDDPPPEVSSGMQDFAGQLRTPALQISDDAVSGALSFDAKTRPATVTVVSGKLAVSGKVTGPTNRGAGGAGVAPALTVSASLDLKYVREAVPGSVPTQKLTLTLDMSAALNVGGGVGLDWGGIESFFPKSLEKRLNTMVTDQGGSVTDISAMRDDMTLGLRSLANSGVPGDQVSFTFARQGNAWRLTTADSTATNKQQAKAKGSIPIPAVPGLKVTGSIGVANARTVIVQRYYAANTLSTLTDAYRDRHVGDQSTDSAWRDFLASSGLIDRIVTKVDSDDRRTGGKFGEVLTRIQSGDVDGLRRPDRRLATVGLVRKDAGALNDLAGWLIDLSTSENPDDQSAAAAFATAFRLPARSADDKTARRAQLQAAMNRMVQRKVRQEDAQSSFVTRHEISRKVITDYVFNEIDKRRRELARKLGQGGDASPRDLQTAAAAKFRRDRRRLLKTDAADADAIARRRRRVEADVQRLRQALALEYAGETIIDLTRDDDDEDKNKALARLGTELQRTLDGNGANVYMGEFMTGEIRFHPNDTSRTGGLQVSRQIKDGQHTLVRPKDIEDSARDLNRRLADGLGVDATMSPVKFRSDAGTGLSNYNPSDPPDEGARRRHYKAVAAKVRKSRGSDEAYNEKHRLKRSYTRHHPSRDFDSLFRKWMKKKREHDARRASAEQDRRRRRRNDDD